MKLNSIAVIAVIFCFVGLVQSPPIPTAPAPDPALSNLADALARCPEALAAALARCPEVQREALHALPAPLWREVIVSRGPPRPDCLHLAKLRAACAAVPLAEFKSASLNLWEGLSAAQAAERTHPGGDLAAWQQARFAALMAAEVAATDLISP